MANGGYTRKEHVRILVLGPTGSGKSSTGNTILGRKCFQSKMSPHSVTRNAKFASAERLGRLISVVDTPGTCDTEMTKQEFLNAVIESYVMASPGPHAFLIVLSFKNRFADECKMTINFIKEYYTESVFKHSILVFTGEDDLIEDGQSVQDFLERPPEELSKLLKKCNYRYLSLNNRSTEGEEEKIRRLLDLVDQVVQKNNGHYTNNLFDPLENGIQKEIDSRIEAFEKQEVKQSKYKNMDKKFNSKYRFDSKEWELRSGMYKKLQESKMVEKSATGSSVADILENIAVGIGVVVAGIAVVVPIIKLISKLGIDDDDNQNKRLQSTFTARSTEFSFDSLEFQ